VGCWWVKRVCLGGGWPQGTRAGHRAQGPKNPPTDLKSGAQSEIVKLKWYAGCMVTVAQAYTKYTDSDNGTDSDTGLLDGPGGRCEYMGSGTEGGDSPQMGRFQVWAM
jgi:hypothetical protein